MNITATSLTGPISTRGIPSLCPPMMVRGWRCDDSSSIVISNTPPTLDSVSLSPLNPTELDNIICQPGTSSDIDGDTVSYLYSWSIDGQISSNTSQTLTGTDFDRGQQVTCTITPYDGQESGNPITSAILTIENSAPSIDDVTLTPYNATEESQLSCTPSNVTDADGDTVSVGTTGVNDG